MQIVQLSGALEPFGCGFLSCYGSCNSDSRKSELRINTARGAASQAMKNNFQVSSSGAKLRAKTERNSGQNLRPPRSSVFAWSIPSHSLPLGDLSTLCEGSRHGAITPWAWLAVLLLQALTAACLRPSLRSAPSHSRARFTSNSTYSAVKVSPAMARRPMALDAISMTTGSLEGRRFRR